VKDFSKRMQEMGQDSEDGDKMVEAIIRGLKVEIRGFEEAEEKTLRAEEVEALRKEELKASKLGAEAGKVSGVRAPLRSCYR
jgi:hypothetical protein